MIPREPLQCAVRMLILDLFFPMSLKPQQVHVGLTKSKPLINPVLAINVFFPPISRWSFGILLWEMATFDRSLNI